MITLGIIGIVAALTIPSLITKYQEKILNSQFKKARSTYSQALIKTAAEFDNSTGCYYNYDFVYERPSFGDWSGCPEFYESFAKNIKVIKKCENNALANGCIPKYNLSQPIQGCSGFNQNSVDRTNTAYVLGDGTIISLYSGSGPLFLVDINGKKGPNKPGYDLFTFEIIRDKKSGSFLFDNRLYNCLNITEGKRHVKEFYE